MAGRLDVADNAVASDKSARVATNSSLDGASASNLGLLLLMLLDLFLMLLDPTTPTEGSMCAQLQGVKRMQRNLLTQHQHLPFQDRAQQHVLGCVALEDPS